jgi:hypothetical protein
VDLRRSSAAVIDGHGFGQQHHRPSAIRRRLSPLPELAKAMLMMQPRPPLIIGIASRTSKNGFYVHSHHPIPVGPLSSTEAADNPALLNKT